MAAPRESDPLPRDLLHDLQALATSQPVPESNRADVVRRVRRRRRRRARAIAVAAVAGALGLGAFVLQATPDDVEVVAGPAEELVVTCEGRTALLSASDVSTGPAGVTVTVEGVTPGLVVDLTGPDLLPLGASRDGTAVYPLAPGLHHARCVHLDDAAHSEAADADPHAVAFEVVDRAGHHRSAQLDCRPGEDVLTQSRSRRSGAGHPSPDQAAEEALREMRRPGDSLEAAGYLAAERRRPFVLVLRGQQFAATVAEAQPDGTWLASGFSACAAP